MNNVDMNTIKEFRRFVNNSIYPVTAGVIINNIKMCCDCDDISYVSEPQALIEFHCNLPNEENLQIYTFKIHDILRNIFIEYFNEAEVASLIKSQIHLQNIDDELKNNLRNTLVEIQHGNPYYLALLVNVVVLHNHNVYVYL